LKNGQWYLCCSPIAERSITVPRACVTSFRNLLPDLGRIFVDNRSDAGSLPYGVEMEFLQPNQKRPSLDRRGFLGGLVGLWGGATLVSQPALLTAAGNSSNCHGNRGRLLSDDSTSLLHRLQLIDSAANEILLSAYEVGDDTIALRVLAGLREAARRGV
jgi:hypothetical protein